MMKTEARHVPIWLWVSFLTLAAYGLAEAAPTNAAPALAAFQLTDQYEKKHAISFPATNVTVIVVADRKGSGQIQDWMIALTKHYASGVAIEGVADMSAVPRLMRSWVRDKFKDGCAYPVMLDWDGPVSRSFHYQPNAANLFVVTRQGIITHHVAGAATDAALQTLFGAIDAALAAPSPRP